MVTLCGLLILSLLAWVYLLTGAGMRPMVAMESAVQSWPLVATMWAAMMVAMMLPSATPAILLYGTVYRRSVGATPPTMVFLLGYLVCWIGFSMLTATVQLAVASPMSMALDSRRASGILLVIAGAYQLSRVKDACLSRCQSPAEFFSRQYRPGSWGAARLGLLHGAYCVGCCWLLMALLFVGGVMNLAWIAALTLLVAAERLLKGGRWVARVSGACLIVWGAILLVG